MPSAARAAEQAAKSFPYRPGAYYGTAGGRTLGAGLIYDSVQYPLLDEDTSFFDTVAGLVYVLTHECDVDPANERLFNESVIICPIIKFEEWVSEFALFSSETAVLQAITDLAGDRIFRATYLPPLPDGSLPFGGILYLRRIKNFKEKALTGDTPWINGGYFVCEPSVFDLIKDDSTTWEREPLETLATTGELFAYKHSGFWQSMDTLRDKYFLEDIWKSGNAPWKHW